MPTAGNSICYPMAARLLRRPVRGTLQSVIAERPLVVLRLVTSIVRPRASPVSTQTIASSLQTRSATVSNPNPRVSTAFTSGPPVSRRALRPGSVFPAPWLVRAHHGGDGSNCSAKSCTVRTAPADSPFTIPGAARLSPSQRYLKFSASSHLN
jgi:hypothetical protein